MQLLRLQMAVEIAHASLIYVSEKVFCFQTIGFAEEIS